MAFFCPDCKQDALQIEESLALAPDDGNDELALQAVVCSHCGLRALAVYRESRRGALDSEAWRHEGYRVRAVDYWAVREAMGACPARADTSCDCVAHRKLGAIDGGMWNGLRRSGVMVNGMFDMRLSV